MRVVGRLRVQAFSDDSCFDDAQRGFIGSIPDARITTPDGRVV